MNEQFNLEEAVKDFHRKYGQEIDVGFTFENVLLRNSLINEESWEVEAELLGPNGQEYPSQVSVDKVAVAKELADLIYVTVGAAVTWGIPITDVLKRVHYSNMSKNGGVREDGKILKGDGYFEPDLKDLFVK